MKARGFTLIELLIVVAIIGIIAAIAIPQLFNAIQKARQKQTVADMRTLSICLSSYAVDNDCFPREGTTTVATLVPHLNFAVRLVPTRDAWQFEYTYETDALGTEYTLISFGSNRVADGPYTYGYTQRFIDDIVHSTGGFVQWPEGVQN